ncbi:hypothetical protein FRB94_009332 [Tulasnella sp. JGI-2019a]|nr:hypothetical protein FRB94_009332 [Tulasnella sp. JGI-2019a]KAG9004869.1 hypothetical protein FRB93_010048 [Tulasnella sp. JGI-2019a]
MFGPFGGPLPAGIYNIRNPSYGAINLTSIINNAPVNMIANDDTSEFQMWEFSYGRKGYRIKNVASGTYLSYSPWAVPARILNVAGYIVSAARSTAEWMLVQTSANFTQRFFQLRVISGENLQPTDDYSLYWNGNLNLYYTTSGTPFFVRSVGTPGPLSVPTLSPVNNKRCIIRNAFYPQICLDAINGGATPSNVVLTNRVNAADSQTWILQKGGRGFRLKNLATENSLNMVQIPGTPSPSSFTTVCQDNSSVEWEFVPSTHGFEIRPVSNSAISLTIWNVDAANNGWPYLQTVAKGTNETTQQWILLEPGTKLPGDYPETNVHIVVFKYNSTASAAQKESVARAFLALKTECVSPSTQKPYIVALKGGSNYSQEGFDKGFEHGFVLEFSTEKDRKYYLDTDPAHDKFKKLVGPLVNVDGDTFVYDFVPGEFYGNKIGPSGGYLSASATPENNVHIVCFKYKPGTSIATKAKVAKTFVDLKTKCVSESTGKPYIVTLEAGGNYSTENFDKGFEHSFVLEFANEAEREYYLNTDPAHNEFKALVGPLTDPKTDVFVFDFIPGVFDKK